MRGLGRSSGLNEITRRYRVAAIADWRVRAQAKLTRIIAAARAAAAFAEFVSTRAVACLPGRESMWERQRAALEARGIIRPRRDHGLPGVPGDVVDSCPHNGPPAPCGRTEVLVFDP